MIDRRTVGRPINVEIEIHDICKYRDYADHFKRVPFNGVIYWEIIDDEDAKEIESDADRNSIDDYHEYLVLYFMDGSKATFRNSYVDMFRTDFC